MRFLGSVPPSRRLLALFLVLTVAPAAGLVSLGWRLLEQDRALETQRALERQDRAADLIVGALSRQIALCRRRLNHRTDPSFPTLAPDAVIVSIGETGISDLPAGRLLYYPVVPALREAPEGPFLATENLEREMAWSPDGETIAFSGIQESETELWLMEDFLPPGRKVQ